MFTCLKVISLENEHDKKNIDPNPNHSDDLATFLHITNSEIRSQRPSHPDCSTKSVPACHRKFENRHPIIIVRVGEYSEQ
jgi:hypothetical protein